MSLPSSIRDNRAKRGSAGDFLNTAIQEGSVLSFVSAYFTVHAYHALKDKLDAAASLRFLFGEPSFISQVDRDKAASRNFSLIDGNTDTPARKIDGSAGTPARSTTSDINPLRPHFLVYVLDSGDVRLTFAQPKAILQLFRELAAGKECADNALCDLFDARTQNGADMSYYSTLAKRALDSIRRTFERRAAPSLLSSRGGLLPTASEQRAEDEDGFELLTWLVILEGQA